VSVKPWAVFVAEFPDDTVEDERDILTFGGRNVAVAIGEILTRLGCDVSAPEYAGEKGWEFGARFKGRRVWCLISSFHPTFFLNFDDPPALLSRGKDAPAYEEIAQKFSAALAEDPRFHDVQWYSREEGPPAPPDGAGAGTPDAPPMAKDELFAQGMALQINERIRPLTRWQYFARVLFGLGFMLGIDVIWGGVILLSRGNFWGVVLLPTGVIMVSLAVLGAMMMIWSRPPDGKA
jgi:hypothetical protein